MTFSETPQRHNSRWMKGQSGNPLGRPIGHRTRIAEKLIADIADIWERRGMEVLERLADEEPAKLASIAFGLVPREALLRVETSEADTMSAEELAEVLRVVRMLRAKTIDAEPESSDIASS